MSMKVVLVTGATGKQGGSLVNALLDRGGFAIRALTRNVNTEAAKELAAKGVAVVPGDLSDKDSLSKACKDVYAVFGVSIPEFFCGVDEELQGRNLVDACKENDVPLLVWSSLPSCKDTSSGKFIVKPFDAKSDVEKYIKAVDQPAIIFRTGGFASNMILFHQLKQDEKDPSKYHFCYPIVGANSPQPWTYVEKDVGPAVLAAIEKWEDSAWHTELAKEPIPLVSYQLTLEEMASIVAKVSGKDVDFVSVPSDGLPPPLISMNHWCNERLWGYGDHIPVDILVKLGVKFHTLDDYVRDEVIPWMNSQDQSAS
ncbi:NAD(P)-binding protein [Calocera cornea HHB12733]|uniref:NAD(P)-binding protein n=1 Tax=Calocera cornea HHB12733 TaxID=1353952 RepID=A0A165HZQ1_9BASI|nr:NAD(P)-binding protein [Calocera cornea HHB12733]